MRLLTRTRYDTKLLRATEYVTDKLSEWAYTAAVFLDISKAYDSVWTAGLIYRLHAAGIPDSSLLLLASYLTDRKFRIITRSVYDGDRYASDTSTHIALGV
jgi:hypothetical protein